VTWMMNEIGLHLSLHRQFLSRINRYCMCASAFTFVKLISAKDLQLMSNADDATTLSGVSLCEVLRIHSIRIIVESTRNCAWTVHS
jgi:hypothetical protein